MHCAGPGLMALGWHNLWTERRPWRLAGAYVLSVTIHALWNGVVLSITGLSLLTGGDPGQTVVALAGGGSIILVGFLVALTIGIFIILVTVTRRLQTGSEVAPSGS